MTRGRVWRLVAATVVVVTVGLVIRNQVEVYRRGVARSEEMRARQPPADLPPHVSANRRAFFDALQPVTIRNCTLERFGGPGDGAYLMCGNLLDDVQSGYSYGIGGHDAWGCEVSTRTQATVHQYDCFNGDRPRCWRGDTTFHDECVGGKTETVDGRRFDTVLNQVEANGDATKRLAMKIDIEGAEWDTILAMGDETLSSIDQLAMELHWSEDSVLGWADDPRYMAAVERVRRFFEVAHIHFNNMSCVGNLAPFPASSFEVLFVSKRLAMVDATSRPVLPNAKDSTTRWWVPDCQLASASPSP
jgi:hypothetical protein